MRCVRRMPGAGAIGAPGRHQRSSGGENGVLAKQVVGGQANPKGDGTRVNTNAFLQLPTA